MSRKKKETVVALLLLFVVAVGKNTIYLKKVDEQSRAALKDRDVHLSVETQGDFGQRVEVWLKSIVACGTLYALHTHTHAHAHAHAHTQSLFFVHAHACT